MLFRWLVTCAVVLFLGCCEWLSARGFFDASLEQLFVVAFCLQLFAALRDCCSGW